MGHYHQICRPVRIFSNIDPQHSPVFITRNGLSIYPINRFTLLIWETFNNLHFIPILSNLNKSQRTPLVILYITLWSTPFPILFDTQSLKILTRDISVEHGNEVCVQAAIVYRLHWLASRQLETVKKPTRQ
jgi:hypothetical protein